MTRHHKKWTKKEDVYLKKHWGTTSIKTIAHNLERTENAIIIRHHNLGLGSFLEHGEYVSFHQLKIALGVDRGGYKNISWIKNRDFPIHTKRVNNSSFQIVYLDEWWEWAEKNRDVLDFSKFEENLLGEEPAWAKIKRRHDIEKNQKYITTPWTAAEDSLLIHLVKKQRYTYSEISSRLRRTNGAVQKRLCELKIPDRPVRADNHTLWTESNLEQLGFLIKLGYGYELISEEIGKSARAIRGTVYRMYLTENLDKVREIMGDGNFGDNRPERTIKQRNAMNTEERIALKESMTSLTAILQYRFKQQLNETEWGHFFQKDMCQNFCSDCLNTAGCDECPNFKKFNPQNCKMCGKTFFEKKENLYCSTCREMKKKQWLRKRFIMAQKG